MAGGDEGCPSGGDDDEEEEEEKASTSSFSSRCRLRSSRPAASPRPGAPQYRHPLGAKSPSLEPRGSRISPRHPCSPPRPHLHSSSLLASFSLPGSRRLRAAASTWPRPPWAPPRRRPESAGGAEPLRVELPEAVDQEEVDFREKGFWFLLLRSSSSSSSLSLFFSFSLASSLLSPPFFNDPLHQRHQNRGPLG